MCIATGIQTSSHQAQPLSVSMLSPSSGNIFGILHNLCHPSFMCHIMVSTLHFISFLFSITTQHCWKSSQCSASSNSQIHAKKNIAKPYFKTHPSILWILFFTWISSSDSWNLVIFVSHLALQTLPHQNYNFQLNFGQYGLPQCK